MIEYSDATKYLWHKLANRLVRPKTDSTYLKQDIRYFKKTRGYLKSYGYFNL